MRNLIRSAVMVAALAVAGPVMAGPLEDAAAANARGDYATVLRLLRPQAERGDALAQASLGFMYANGQGVPQDYGQAVKWFRLAAEQGNALAQFNLGIMYNEGQGVPQDYVQAVK